MPADAEFRKSVLSLSNGLLQPVLLLFGECFQKIRNIPFAATTARECPRPIGDGIDIHALLEQALDGVSPGAAAMAYNFIFFRFGVIGIHEGIVTICQRAIMP